MSIRQALIYAANPHQRNLPLQMLIDGEGTKRSALEIILREAAGAGIEEFCIVVCPGDEESYTKAWGDMTSLTDVASTFALVERQRGQQLKDQAQLDGWQRDGSADHVASLCDWE